MSSLEKSKRSRSILDQIKEMFKSSLPASYPTPSCPGSYSATSNPPNVFSEAYRTYRKPVCQSHPQSIAHSRRTVFVPAMSASLSDENGSASLLVFIVDRAHERSSRGKDIIHENKDSLLRCELDTFSTYQLVFNSLG